MAEFQIPAIVATDAIRSTNAWAESLNKVTVSSEKAGAEVAKTFSSTTKWIEQATKNLVKAQEAFNGWDGSKVQKSLAQFFYSIETGGKATTKAEKQLLELHKQINEFNIAIETGVRSAKIWLAQHTAMIDAAAKTQISLAKAKAELVQLGSEENKELANVNALVAARKKLNATLGASQGQAKTDAISTRITAKDTSNFIKARAALSELTSDYAYYQQLISRNTQAMQANLDVVKAHYEALVYEKSAIGLLRAELRKANTATSEQATTLAASIEVSKARAKADTEVKSATELLNIAIEKSSKLSAEEIVAKNAALAVSEKRRKSLIDQAAAEALLQLAVEESKAALTNANIANEASLVINKKKKQYLIDLATSTELLVLEEKRLLQETSGTNKAALERIAVLKETKKGITALAAEEQRLTNEEALLAKQLELLKSGIGSKTAALQAEINALNEASVYTAKLAGEQQLAKEAIKAFASGLLEETALLTKEAAIKQASANAAAAFRIAQDATAQSLIKSTAAVEAYIQGLKKSGSYIQEMENKTKALRDSIAFLASSQGQYQSQLSVEESLLKERNKLLAEQSSKVAALRTQIDSLKKSLSSSSTGDGGGLSFFSRLKTALTGVSVHTTLANQAIQGLRSGLYGLGISFGIFTSSTLLVSAAVYGMVSQLRELVKAGAEFEDAITRVAAVSTTAAYGSNEYISSLAALEEKAESVAATSRFTAKEVTEAMNEMAMSGMEVDEIIRSTRDVMNLAAIGATGFGEAADIATNIMMGFGLTAEELSSVIDKMTVAVTSSNETISQLGNALSYIAPVAAAFGVNIDLVVASTEVLSNAGIKASRAGTAMRRILVSLFTPTEKGAAALKQMGIEVSALGDEFEGLEGLESAIPNLGGGAVDGTEKLTEAFRQLYIMTDGATKNLNLLNDIVGVRALPGFIALISSLDDGVDSLFAYQEALRGASGAQEEMMRKISDTLVTDWETFTGAIDAVRQSLFELESSSLSDFVNALAAPFQLIAKNKDYLAQLVQAFKDLGSALLDIIKILALVKAAMIAVGISVWAQGVVAAISPATAAWLSFGTAASVASTQAAASAGVFSTAMNAIKYAYGSTVVQVSMFTTASASAAVGAGILAGALTAVKIAAIALLRTLIIPAAVIYGLYTLVDAFFDIDEAIFGATDTLSNFNTEISDTKAALTAEANALLSGGLKEIYAQISAQEEQLEITRSQALGDQERLVTLKQQTEELRKLKSQALEAHETIKEAGKFAWFSELTTYTKELKAQQKILDELVAKRNQLSDASIGLATKGAGGAASQASQMTQALDEQIARQKELVTGLSIATTAISDRYNLAIGTAADHLERWRNEELGLQQAISTTKTEIDGYERALSALTEVQRITDTSDPAYLINSQAMAEFVTNIDLARNRLGLLETKQKEVFAAIKSGEQSIVGGIESYATAITNTIESFNSISDKVGTTSDKLDALDLSKKIVSSEVAFSSAKSAVSELSTELAVAKESIKGLTNEQKKPILDELQKKVTETTDEIYELGKAVDTFTALEELAEKYDKATEQANKLVVAQIELGTLYASGRFSSMTKYQTSLEQTIGSTLELDKATGQLTKTSIEAVSSLKDSLIGELTKVNAELAKLSAEKPTETVNRKIEYTKRTAEALQAAIRLLTTGDLAALARQQELVSEDTEKLTDRYQHQIDVLEALGASSAALRISRKKEIESLGDSSKAVLELKYALEDLDDVKEDALSWHDTTKELQDLFDTMTSTIGGGNVFVEWYDASPVVDSTTKIKKTLKESLTDIKQFGATAKDELTDHFDALETSLNAAANAAVEAIKRIREESNKPIEVPSVSVPVEESSSSNSWRVSSDLGLSESQIDQLRNQIWGMSDSVTSSVAVLDAFGMALKVNFDTKTVSKMNVELEGTETLVKNIGGFTLSSPVSFTQEELTNLALAVDGMQELESGMHKLSIGGKDFSIDIDTKTISLATKELDAVKEASEGAGNALASTSAGFTSVSSEASNSVQAVDAVRQQLTELDTLLENVPKDGIGLSAGLTDTQAFEKATQRVEELRAKLVEAKQALLAVSTSDSSLDVIAEKMQAAKTVSDDYVSAMEKYNALRLKLVATGNSVIAQLKLEPEELKKLGKEYDSLASKQEQYLIDMNAIAQLLSQDAISMAEYLKKADEFTNSYVSSLSGKGEFFVNMKEDIESVSDVLTDLTSEFKGSLVDAMVDGSSIKLDDFVSLVKRKLAEIAVNTIFVNVVGTFTGLSNIGSSITGGGSSSGGSASSTSTLGTVASVASTASGFTKLSNLLTGNGIGTSLSKALTKFTGATSDFATNLSSTANWVYGAGIGLGSLFGNLLFDGKGESSTGSVIGSTAGTVIASGLGWTGIGAIVGGILGGVGGGWLGSLFGDDTPRFGGYATSFSGGGMEDNVTAEGAFGLTFGISDQGSKNIKAADYQETLDALATVSKTMSEFYGTELSSKVEASLSNMLGDFNKWGYDLDDSFNSIFTTILKAADDAEGNMGDGMGHLLRVAVGDLGGTTEEMANQISDGIAIVNASVLSFDSVIGRLLGMDEDGTFDSLEKTVIEWKSLLSQFSAEGESASAAIERITTNISELSDASLITAGSIDEIATSADWLVWVAGNLANAIAGTGLTSDEFNTLETNAFEHIFSDEERATMTLDSAREAIADWNEDMGHFGDSIVDTTAEFKDYLEALDLSNPAHHDAYVQAILVSSAFIDLDEAMETLYGTTTDTSSAISDFIDSIKPEEETFEDVAELFKEWGMSLPATSDALYALIEAGAFTVDQLAILSGMLDELNTAWDYLDTIRSDAADIIESRRDSALDAEDTRYDDLVDSINDAHDDRVDAINDEYDKLTESLNDQLDELEDAIGDFADVVDSATDAIKSLVEATDGIDETRQRNLQRARDAIETIRAGGEVPEDLTDIISDLGSVDQNDFATREDWEAAVQENLAVLTELQGLAGGKEDSMQKQIDLLEEQLDLAEELHEAALDAEDARLEKELEAAEKEHDALVETINADFDGLITTIEEGSIEQLIALLEQNGILLDMIPFLKSLTDATDLGEGDDLPQEIIDLLDGNLDETIDQTDQLTVSSEALKSIREQLAQYLEAFQAYREGLDAYGMDLLAAVRAGTTATESLEDALSAEFTGLKVYLTAFGEAVVTAFSDSITELGDRIQEMLNAGGSEDPELKVPAFASGGKHRGGLRLVGERGPELEFTGPSLISPASSFDSLMSSILSKPEASLGTALEQGRYQLPESATETSDAQGEYDLEAMAAAIDELVATVKSGNEAVAKNTARSYEMFSRWEQIGMPQSRSDIYPEP